MATEQVKEEAFLSFLDNAGLELKQQKECWQGDLYDTGLQSMGGHQSHRKRSSTFLSSLGALICASTAVLYLLLSCYRHLSLELNPRADIRRLATGGASPPPFTCGGASHELSGEEEEKEGGAECGDSLVSQRWLDQAYRVLEEPHDLVTSAKFLSSAAPSKASPRAGLTKEPSLGAAGGEKMFSSTPQDASNWNWQAWGMCETLTRKTKMIYDRLVLINQICCEGIHLLSPEDACNLTEAVAGLHAITLSASSLAPTEHEPQRQAVVQNTIELIESTVAAVAANVPDAHSHSFVKRLVALKNLLKELRVPSPRPKGATPRKYQKKFATWFNITDLLIPMTAQVVNSLFIGRFIPGWVPAEGRVKRSLGVLKKLLKTRISQTLADSTMGWWIVQCQKNTKNWILFPRDEYFQLSRKPSLPRLPEQRAQLEQAFADIASEALLPLSDILNILTSATAPEGLSLTTAKAKKGLKGSGQDPHITMHMTITIHEDPHAAHPQSSGSAPDDGGALLAHTRSSGSPVRVKPAGYSDSLDLPLIAALVGSQPQRLSRGSAPENDKESVLRTSEGHTEPLALSDEQHHQAPSRGTGTGTLDEEGIDSQLQRLLTLGPKWEDISDEDKD